MAIFCIGDIHGKFDKLVEVLRTLPRNSNVLCVGDIGIGFADSLDPSCLYDVNGTAALRDIYLWMIRGNHDNPFSFREDQMVWNDDLSNIKLMSDVDSLEIEGNHVIFVGGAISVDRSHEGRIDGTSWWQEEPVHPSAPSRVYNIVQQYGPADLIITHAGPITTLPVIDEFEPNIYHYSQNDSTLLDDVNKERTLLSDCVQYSRAPMCVYGHYHVPLDYSNTGVNYRCVAELETWEFKSDKSKHLPEAIISEEEKAKVVTMPINLKATAKLPLPKVISDNTPSANTLDVATEELVAKTEELRQTAKVSVRPPLKPFLPVKDEDSSAPSFTKPQTLQENAIFVQTSRISLKSLPKTQGEKKQFPKDPSPAISDPTGAPFRPTQVEISEVASVNFPKKEDSDAVIATPSTSLLPQFPSTEQEQVPIAQEVKPTVSASVLSPRSGPLTSLLGRPTGQLKTKAMSSINLNVSKSKSDGEEEEQKKKPKKKRFFFFGKKED
ncbi:metallophosphoesterase [Akkermansiaceae bacterium]|nr:metallophosphoesterase [Akkermansiaceae bacterium]